PCASAKWRTTSSTDSVSATPRASSAGAPTATRKPAARISSRAEEPRKVALAVIHQGADDRMVPRGRAGALASPRRASGDACAVSGRSRTGRLVPEQLPARRAADDHGDGTERQDSALLPDRRFGRRALGGEPRNHRVPSV